MTCFTFRLQNDKRFLLCLRTGAYIFASDLVGHRHGRLSFHFKTGGRRAVHCLVRIGCRSGRLNDPFLARTFHLIADSAAADLLADDLTFTVFVFILGDGIAFRDALTKRRGRHGLRHALHFHLGGDFPKPFLQFGKNDGRP